jgi:hypothetical protein
MKLEVCDDSCDWSLSCFLIDLDIAFCSTIGTLCVCLVCSIFILFCDIKHLSFMDCVISINVCWIDVKA